VTVTRIRRDTLSALYGLQFAACRVKCVRFGLYVQGDGLAMLHSMLLTSSACGSTFPAFQSSVTVFIMYISCDMEDVGWLVVMRPSRVVLAVPRITVVAIACFCADAIVIEGTKGWALVEDEVYWRNEFVL
jgi:hypothetical protein